LREQVTSQHLGWLRKALDRPYKNCRIVWPQDAVSSYDLGESADLVLVAWSSIGLEFARMGAPVLAATMDPSLSCFPADDFMEFSETSGGYFRQLESLLDRPASLDTVLRAYRWWYLYFLGNTLDLGDLVTDRQAFTLPAYRLPKEAKTIRDIIVDRRDILDIQHERLRGSQSADLAVAEREALLRSLRRIVHYLLTGVDDTCDFRLTVLRREALGAGPAPSGNGRVLVADGRRVEYWSDGQSYKRFSPLAARLAAICGNPVNGDRPKS
jgi:hypothetical protein